MNGKLVTEQGNTKYEAELKLKNRYPNAKQEIISIQPFRERWKFWRKKWEIKAWIYEETQEKDEKKEAEKTRVSRKIRETGEEKKKKLLQMLTQGEEYHYRPLESYYGNEKHEKDGELIAKLKGLIERLEEKNKGEEIPLPLKKMEMHLKEKEIDERIIDVYMEKMKDRFKYVPDIKEEEMNESLYSLIENQLRIMEPEKLNEKKMVVLVGPTGVGKTTTLAKIAWELVKKGKKIGFINTDTFRSGAKEQLEQYGEKMGIKTITVKNANELREAIQYFKNANKVDHILIDTVGKNPFVEEGIQMVKKYVNAAAPESEEKEQLICLVVTATSKISDLKETVERFSPVGVDALIFTKLDETYHIGNLLNVFNFTKVPLLYVTDGQDITKNIHAPTKRELAERILNRETEIKGRALI